MKKQFIDQIGNQIEIVSPPRRIICLVPSLTEFLFDLNLLNEIVGVTRYCVHPVEICKGKTQVGGTKNIDVELIKSLNPDLIIASKEENVKEDIDKLFSLCPVWTSDIKNLEDVYWMMLEIGEMTGKKNEATGIIKSIQKEFEELNQVTNKLTVVYFIWRKPYMTVGGDTFIHHILNKIGLENLFVDEQRYPIVSFEELKRLNPDLIFLSSEPFPFSQKHIEEFQALVPDSKVLLVDGEYFSWYGSRLIQSVPYFNKLISSLNY